MFPPIAQGFRLGRHNQHRPAALEQQPIGGPGLGQARRIRIAQHDQVAASRRGHELVIATLASNNPDLAGDPMLLHNGFQAIPHSKALFPLIRRLFGNHPTDRLRAQRERCRRMFFQVVREGMNADQMRAQRRARSAASVPTISPFGVLSRNTTMVFQPNNASFIVAPTCRTREHTRMVQLHALSRP